MPSIIYNSLPTNIKLRVGAHPNVTGGAWCGYNPNNYSLPVFLRGIYKEVYMQSVTEIKATITEPWLARFIEEDPEAFLGDAFRHIEAGKIFPEEYEDIDSPDQPLGPVSGHHLNIITETDRTIEKWHIRISHNRDTYATYFKDFPTFKQFVSMLKGNMMNGIKDALALIVKAVMLSDPTKAVFDEKDFARVFGKVAGTTGGGGTDGVVPDSKLGTAYNKMMQKLINKYYGKGVALWRNYKWYNPFAFSFDDSYEKMNKKELYEAVTEGKDAAKYHMQQTYTVAHTENGDDDVENTLPIHHLHRNDCLFALMDAIDNALIVLTTEKSSEYWLGKESMLEAFGTQEEALRQQQLQGLEGEPLRGGQVRPDDSHNTSASSSDDFEVSARKEDLILLLNPEDYKDLKRGISRRGQMDVRAVNLDMLEIDVYPMRGMKAGFARLIDSRAFKIRSYFQMFDTQEPAEKLTWRYKMFYQFAITMFKNFAGCLFLPSPHFVASPSFYNKFNVIGQPVEKKS